MKKHLKAKQILAALLCFCMIAAVIPAMPTAAAIDVEYTFDFSASTPDAGCTSYDGGNWKFTEGSGITAVGLNSWFEFLNLAKSGSYAIFDLGELQSGEYDVTFGTYKWAAGGLVAFYLIPYDADVSTACKSEYLMGNISFYAASDATSTDELESFNVPTTGKYKMVAKGTGIKSSKSSNYHAGLMSLKLKRVSDGIKRINFIPWDIPEAASGYDGGNWKYYSKSASVVGPTASARNYLQVTGLNKNQWIAYDIGALKSGEYNVEVENWKYKGGTIAKWYLVSKNASDIGAACTADALLGTVVTFQSNPADVPVTDTLANYQVKEDGDYLLVMMGTGTYATGNTNAGSWALLTRSFMMRRVGDYKIKFEKTINLIPLTWKSHDALIAYEGDYSIKSVSGGVTLSTGSAFFQASKLTSGSYVAFNAGNFMAGKYDVDITSYKCASGFIADYYLIPASATDISAACNENTKLGTADSYAATDVLADPEKQAQFNVYEDGDYLLVIMGTGKYNSQMDSSWRTGNNVFANSVTMDRVSDADPKPELEAEAFTLGFGSSNGGVALANIYNATIAENKWKINIDETDMIDQLTNTGRHGMNAEYTNFKVYEDEVIAYDFNAAVAGDYELVLCVGESTDYGVNAEVFVNDVSVGKMFNDENGASSTLVLKNKGFGKVTLKEGVNTLKIKGLAPDVIDAVTKSGSDRAGGTQLYLSTATFTPKAASDVVVDRVEISCPNNSISVGATTSVSAKAIMSDGSEVAVTPKTITTGIIE